MLDPYFGVRCLAEDKSLPGRVQRAIVCGVKLPKWMGVLSKDPRLSVGWLPASKHEV